jgi:hypothetical protein
MRMLLDASHSLTHVLGSLPMHASPPHDADFRWTAAAAAALLSSGAAIGVRCSTDSVVERGLMYHFRLSCSKCRDRVYLC